MKNALLTLALFLTAILVACTSQVEPILGGEETVDPTIEETSNGEIPTDSGLTEGDEAITDPKYPAESDPEATVPLTFVWYEDEFVKFQYPEGWEVDLSLTMASYNHGDKEWASLVVRNLGSAILIAKPGVLLDEDSIHDTLIFNPPAETKIFESYSHLDYSTRGEPIATYNDIGTEIARVGPEILGLRLLSIPSYENRGGFGAILLEQEGGQAMAKVSAKYGGLSSVRLGAYQGTPFDHELIVDGQCQMVPSSTYTFSDCTEIFDTFFTSILWKD